MKTTPSNCNEQLLLRALQGDLPQEENERLFSHIANCESCQSRISDLAASGDEWIAVTNAIKDQPPADEPLERLSSFARGIHAPRWTESMAKQLLLPPSHPEMLGRLGRYEIERLIGAGGMGLVFKAFDRELNRPLAIKMLSPHLADSGAARQRFAREARAAAAVVHPHVVPIHNVESEGELPYLVMQYVSGESLQDRIDREGPLELEQILRIGMQVADGLEAAHQQGLVHRDIKPSNILLEDRVERALITDFGLARAGDDASLTRTGFHPGTPHYMSPEQASGKTVDARSDLFSLGSMFYAMSTGRPPFRDESSLSVMRLIAESNPPPMTQSNSRLPDWWVVFVKRLMAKSPSDRFASASEVKSVLKECLRHFESPASATVPKVLQRTWWFARKPSICVAGGLVMLSFLLCGFLLTQDPAPPISGGAKEESEVKFVSSDEENFNEVVKSLASSHGDWITNITTQGIGKNEACSAILKSEGMEYFGVGTGYHLVRHPEVTDSEMDHRISIAWPREKPSQGVMIGLKTQIRYYRSYRNPTGFETLVDYLVRVDYYQSEVGLPPSDVEERPVEYEGEWNPLTRTLTCKPSSGDVSDSKWVNENTFRIALKKTGELEIVNLPLRSEFLPVPNQPICRRLSCNETVRNGPPTRATPEPRDIFAGLGGMSWGGISLEMGGIQELNVTCNVYEDTKKIYEKTNVVRVGCVDKLLFGHSQASALLANPDGFVPGYFWYDRATGERSEGMSYEKWRKDLEERGVSDPQLYEAKLFMGPPKYFLQPEELFPWYEGFKK
jgi:serine/threonine protein kinase